MNKNKNVLILTFSKVYNRGANLQCFALMNVIQKLGFNVSFLDIQLPKSKMNFKGFFFEIINNFLASRFRKKVGFKYTRQYNSFQELQINPPKSDYYIVGSDQVWNPEITNYLDPRVYFFCFLPFDSKKFAYAASFGLDYWVKTNYDNEILDSLKTFASIGVREKSGIDICRNIFSIENVEHVLDPSLLLSKEELLLLIKKQKKSKKNLIFSYLLYEDQDIIKILDVITKNLNSNNDNKGISRLLKKIYGVSSWLFKIYNSDFVITNSFHCMAMSIVLHKKFIVIPTFPNREERMLSLLKILGLENRFIPNLIAAESSINILREEIDYLRVDKILEIEKEKSFNFIKTQFSLI